MFKIEDGIERPLERNAKYPFLRMNVDQSFFVPGDRKVIQIVRNAAYICKKHHNRKFQCNTRKEDGIPGIRVWRIK